ncbi:MAG: extracellular solute-binding protein, partial [Clostridiales bacterium]|nr:extracellular solute-binding protein [Clostridiales bacterium]
LAVGLAPSDVCSRVNSGQTTFKAEYREVADKTKALLNYAEPNPYAYSYNDACTAFAKGESAMFPIGSYAVPQILSVNPDMNIDSFTFPANENEADNVLNSGIDLQFSVMKESKNTEASYEVLRFLFEDETVQIYLDEQGGIPCKEGDFELPVFLSGMEQYIRDNRMSDYHDHHYPSEMGVDALIQTYLMDNSSNAAEAFLDRFDNEWVRYNRDLIAKVKKYEEGQK